MPWRLDSRHNDLNGPAEALVLEAGAQAGMALQKGVYGRLEGLLVERPLQIERELDSVNVGRLNIVKRMEQQAFLQRRERQDCIEVRIFALQPLNLALRKSNQRKIRTAYGRRSQAGRQSLQWRCLQRSDAGTPRAA